MLASDRPFFRYLSSVGDGSGSKEWNSDYSSSEGVALITCPANTVLECARLIVSARGASGMRAEGYGNITAGLSTGVVVEHLDAAGSVITDLTAGLPVKSNAQWGNLCYDADIKTWGAGDDFLLVRWTFSRTGAPVILRAGEKLQVRLNDDLSSLDSHLFHLQGQQLVFDSQAEAGLWYVRWLKDRNIPE